MSSERGWYPDPSNEHTMRFWTGTNWIGERVWDGATWVDRTEPDLESPAPPTEPAASCAPASRRAGLLDPLRRWFSGRAGR